MCAKVLATHASTWVRRYSSPLQWSVPLRQRGHVAMVLCVLCTKCTLYSNHRLTRVIFHTHKTTSPPERPFYHYIHSHRVAAEMWTTMKNNLLGKKCFICSFYLYRFRKYVSYGFHIKNFCNREVHYETPCMIWTRSSLREDRSRLLVRVPQERTAYSVCPRSERKTPSLTGHVGRREDRDHTW